MALKAAEEAEASHPDRKEEAKKQLVEPPR